MGDKEAFKLRLTPLGGLGEVGMNCMIVDLGKERVMIDCGVTFADTDAFGADIFFADWTSLFKGKNPLGGVFLTHGHEDHIGAIPHLVRDLVSHNLKIPIYGTRMTLTMVEHKLREHNLLGDAELREVKPREENAHRSLTFEFIEVNHSIPEAAAIVFHTPLGAVIHTGDWRVDYTPSGGKTLDLSRFAEYGDEGVYCLMGDSTNVMTPGVGRSEAEVAVGLSQAVKGAEGRVFVTLFSSNIWRVQALLKIAHAQGRKVLLMGRSLNNNVKMARDNGLLELPADDLFIDPYEMDMFSPDRIMVILTGSQGEPRAALTQMAFGERRQLKLKSGDRILMSARVIPGNELKINRMLNALWRIGVEVITSRDMSIHTTGHAYREEMKLMLHLTRPSCFVPVHGDSMMMLEHAKLGKACGIKNVQVIHNGDVLEIEGETMRLVDQRKAGRQFLDGRARCGVENNVIRDRKRIARAGLIMVVVEIDVVSGDVLSQPRIAQRGAWDEVEEPALKEALSHTVQVTLDGMDRGNRVDLKALTSSIEIEVRRHMKRKCGRKPQVEVIVVEVD